MLRELRDRLDCADLKCDMHCSACGRKDFVAAGDGDVSIGARLDCFDSPDPTIPSAEIVAR